MTEGPVPQKKSVKNKIRKILHDTNQLQQESTYKIDTLVMQCFQVIPKVHVYVYMQVCDSSYKRDTCTCMYS